MASIFPANNAWITPRSSSSKITTNNCQIITNQKIDHINKILINASTILASGSVSGTIRYGLNVGLFSITNNESGFIKELDITKYVVEKALYDTLTIAPRATETYGGLFIQNTSYYTSKTNTINIVAENIKGAWETWGISAFSTMIQSALNDVEVKNNGLWVYYGGEFQRVFTSGDFRNDSKNNPMSAQFRVYYSPLGESVNLETVKTNPQPNEFTIPFSQQQPIVNNVTLGREMQSLTNRTGCETKEVVRTFTDFHEFRKPGAFYREKDKNGKPTGDVWRLTKVQLQIFSDRLFRVMETWSKNWTLQSPNVPINREFRSWNIPADIVQRNLHWNDHCFITTKEDLTLPNDTLLAERAKKQLLYRLFNYNGSELFREECSVVWFYTIDGNTRKGAVLSCSAFGFGNSVVITGKTKDNLSAGVQRVKSDDKDGNYQFCKDVYYCNENGKLDRMCIQVASGLSSNNTEAYYAYPEYYDDGTKKLNGIPTDGTTLFKPDESFRIRKDPSEQLNFTYQLHLTTDNPYLVIGASWAADNPLVKPVAETGTSVKIWYIRSLIPAGAKVMTTINGDVAPESDTTVSVDTVNNSISFTFTQQLKDMGVLGICITDEYNNVLLGYNSNEDAEFYLKFTHFYDAIKKALNQAD